MKHHPLKKEKENGNAMKTHSALEQLPLQLFFQALFTDKSLVEAYYAI